MIKIISKKQYDALLDEIKNDDQCYEDLVRSSCKTIKQKDLEIQNIKSERDKLIKIKDKSIKELENTIKNKNTQIEELTLKVNDINKLETKLEKLKKSNIKNGSAKGGLIKEINKLKSQLDAKERVIEEYKIALIESEKRNSNQANKIKELTSKIEHNSIEYKNDGLSKQTKSAFKKGKK